MIGPKPSISLTRRTLVKVALRIAVVVAMATLISYFHVKSSLQNQILEQLHEYIQQRGMRESSIFLLARDDLRTFAQDYAERLTIIPTNDPKGRFKTLFSKREDAATRLRRRYFERHDVTGFVGKHVQVNAVLRRQLVTGFDMLAQYGPAWRNRFTNLYLITPDHAILMYWPDKPWGLNADEWQVNAKLALTSGNSDEVLVTGANQQNTQGSSWSDLYFDYAVNSWVVSVTEPIQGDDGAVLWVGHDILLQELIERTINNHLEGTYNLIFRDDGQLIAHPQFMDAIQAQSGDLSILEADDPNLSRIFNLVRHHGEESALVENAEDDQYLAIARLQGPGWYLVNVFPKAIITKQALQTARLILLLGATALLLEIAILFFVLKRLVAEPLDNLVQATNRIAAGDFAVALNDRRHDEIGRLARSFNTMSREINARQTELNERSAKLAVLNRQLEHELQARKRVELEVAHQREALYQSEKLSALGSLLAGIAHELNNPLSIIVGRTIMLEERLQGSSHASAAAKIRNAAERCARIVKTFLSIARHQEPVRAPVSVEQVVETALELVGYSLRAEGIEVSPEIDPDLPELCADANQLVQVFTNLFLNAQQAMGRQRGARKLVISARHDQENAAVLIRVSDTGPGIPRDIQLRIFDPFFTTKRVGEGTGLGLSVSHSFIQAHHGTIQVDSEPHKGTTFIISLPVGAPSHPAHFAPQAALANSTDRSILVVDDEAEIVEVLEEILSGVGYRVTTAESGRMALAKIALRPFDLIVSDLRMADMDGRALYEELKITWPEAAERMIFITGDTLNESFKPFLKTTQRPIIEKPFVPEDVRRLIARELERLEPVAHAEFIYRGA